MPCSNLLQDLATSAVSLRLLADGLLEVAPLIHSLRVPAGGAGKLGQRVQDGLAQIAAALDSRDYNTVSAVQVILSPHELCLTPASHEQQAAMLPACQRDCCCPFSRLAEQMGLTHAGWCCADQPNVDRLGRVQHVADRAQATCEAADDLAVRERSLCSMTAC